MRPGQSSFGTRLNEAARTGSEGDVDREAADRAYGWLEQAIARRFWALLAGLVLVGLVLRVGYLTAQPGVDPTFARPILDGAYYMEWASELVDGGNGHVRRAARKSRDLPGEARRDQRQARRDQHEERGVRRAFAPGNNDARRVPPPHGVSCGLHRAPLRFRGQDAFTTFRPTPPAQ